MAILLMAIVAMAACSETTISDNPLDEALASGMPTLAGFVGDECGCKDMRPTLEELASEFDGRCNIVIVSAIDHKDLARQYEIILTPTQVFFDSSGQETTRHIGYWSKEEIVDQLEELGVA